jgi:hypothetical protein
MPDKVLVNLSQVQQLTHLQSPFLHVAPNQTFSVYEQALHSDGRYEVNDATGVAGLEGLYSG